jgi:hypothetical protein
MSDAPSGTSADAATFMGMLASGCIAQVLRALAELHIADHLAAGPRTAEEVAEREGARHAPRTA